MKNAIICLRNSLESDYESNLKREWINYFSNKHLKLKGEAVHHYCYRKKNLAGAITRCKKIAKIYYLRKFAYLILVSSYLCLEDIS